LKYIELRLGTPCDSAGHPIEKGTAPEPRSDKAPDDWSPFDSQGHFRLGTWLYHKTEVSAGDIDELMDIWGSGFSLDQDKSLPPFDSHNHLYETIDSIDHGNAPWHSFTTSYAGEIGPNAPSWQTKEYTVCYRDPRVVIANLFDNPDFNGQFEYAPYVEINQSGERCWNEFMSGNLSWRHAVSNFHFQMHKGEDFCANKLYRQLSTKKTHQLRAQHTVPSFWEPIRPLSPSRLDMLNTILSTYR